jgi:hypothetical protein
MPFERALNLVGSLSSVSAMELTEGHMGRQPSAMSFSRFTKHSEMPISEFN